jgi:hypothetical protein
MVADERRRSAGNDVAFERALHLSTAETAALLGLAERAVTGLSPRWTAAAIHRDRHSSHCGKRHGTRCALPARWPSLARPPEETGDKAGGLRARGVDGKDE